MAYDLGPLRSYVRFYLSVVAQLHTALDAITQSHETVRAALEPFAQALAPVQSPALQTALAPAAAIPAAIEALWQPQDPKDLSGLTDVYEVVGRFTFQGVDNENLARVQALVSSARNEVHAQRLRLAELRKVPELARATADRLASEEQRRSAQHKADQLAAFAPLAETLRMRAKQTIDAVRGVPVPQLDDVNTAADEYRTYARKVDQVYQTCLPFLRKALSDMYQFAGCEVPSSWPDSLPIQQELPPELLMVPPSDSPELQHARAGLNELDEEEVQLNRARDDITVTVARLEGDLAGYLNKDAEVLQRIEQAAKLVKYANVLDQLDQVRRSIATLEQQKAQRTQTVGELMQRHKQTEAAIEALEQELKNRTQEIGLAGQRLAVERDNEPALFGKDDWRARVADLEQQIEDLRNAYAQRQGVLNQLKIDLSSLAVQVQTEQSQSELIERWRAEASAREKTLSEEARQLDSQLGPARPLQSPTVGDADQLLTARHNERAELLERVERTKTDIRRNKEEIARILSRLKQIEAERHKVTDFVQSAQVAATQGREAAMRQLAARRRAAVDQHVNDILGGLEQSLSSVDSLFVEPAREAMLRQTDPGPSVAKVVREHADKLAPVIESLSQPLEQQLLSQDALLGQVQREFCDAAVEACRSAWGA